MSDAVDIKVHPDSVLLLDGAPTYVYLVRMRSDHSLCSIWTTRELADSAALFYDKRWLGMNLTYVTQVELNVTRPLET